MSEELFEWILMLVRWVHITTAVTWIGTSIFFMWLDRSFEPNPESKRAGHVGDLWMVHGGGFYHVEKLQMGQTRVPDRLHWFKWESYWTWISGMALVALVFYTGDGVYLLDSAVSSVNFMQALLLSLFSIFGSWFFYDAIWESRFAKEKPSLAHALTILWLSAMSYALCHVLSGRAAYLHMGALMGTWMAANVFMRIIPRQVKMVEAAVNGQSVDPDWAKNAKYRSTYNTYLTLPVIFIMLSNHFPSTYGSPYNWLILLLISAAGAMIREYFVARLKRPKRAISIGLGGLALICALIVFSNKTGNSPNAAIARSESALTVGALTENKKTIQGDGESAPHLDASLGSVQPNDTANDTPSKSHNIRGVVRVEGTLPKPTKLTLPSECAKQHVGEILSNELLVRDGKVQNVLVRVIAGHETLPIGEIPKSAVEVDQRGCLYQPRLVAARVGQEVVFINSDPLFHNVRSFGKENASFNLSMPLKDQRISRRFDRAEIPLQTKCSVHPWMGANLAIMDHPYFGVTGESGAFEIRNLPAGAYALEIWHEVLGTLTQKLVVSETGATPLEIVFKRNE